MDAPTVVGGVNVIEDILKNTKILLESNTHLNLF